MLSVNDALQRILDKTTPLPAESVALQEALGRVLAHDIISAYDLPPFANSSMDGYAVIFEDVQSASSENPAVLSVIEEIPAGYAPSKTLQRGQAARIMTGAPVPTGTTAVVPVELTEDSNGKRSEQVRIVQGVGPFDNIRPVGEDVKVGETILTQGRRLRPADLGVLAGLGFSAVSVIRRPRVAVISTGDELLTPDQPLAPGKIRDSNGYAIPAMISSLGAIPLRLGIARDQVEDVRSHFQAAIDQQADLILSSAGVSVGAFDVVKTVLNELGSADFWKVNMRPGKPLTFGEIAGKLFLGLPGNPVSALVTFMVFARPAIQKMMGLDADMAKQTARLGETMTSDGRTTFVRVRLARDNGELVAHTTGTQSSGAISSMVKADGLLVIPAGVREIQAGESAEVWLLDSGL